MQSERYNEHMDVDKTANSEHHQASLVEVQNAEKCDCIYVLSFY